jgi:hypothetical protein
VDKSSQIICALAVILTETTQSKKSPKRRKFAQSGHPGRWVPAVMDPSMFFVGQKIGIFSGCLFSVFFCCFKMMQALERVQQKEE